MLVASAVKHICTYH